MKSEKKITEEFYLIVNPGFENELQQEILEIFSNDAVRSVSKPVIKEIETGGIQIQCSLESAFYLQRRTKLATRILWRLHHFFAKEFWQFEKGILHPDLHNKLAKYFIAEKLKNLKFQLEIAASKSKLNNEKRLQEILVREWTLKKKWTFIDKDPSVEITFYVRNFIDQVTLSIDLTGPQALYHRGICSFNSEAPVRETIAAFCIRQMIAGTPRSVLHKTRLLDPMCGRGTFLFEAHEIYRPQYFRDFPIENYITSNHLHGLSQQGKNTRVVKAGINNGDDKSRINKSDASKTNDLLFQELIGQDKSVDSLKAFQKNLQNQTAFNQISISKDPVDFFSTVEKANQKKAGDDVDSNLWIITNPPYGERLKLDFDLQSLFKASFLNYKSQRLGFLWPRSQFKNLKKDIDYFQSQHSEVSIQLVSLDYFKNGGIEVGFAVFDQK